MPRQKKYASNAEKQKAYRERKKGNVTKSNVTNNIVTLPKPQKQIGRTVRNPDIPKPKKTKRNEITIPTYIQLEQLIKQYKNSSTTAKYLYERLAQKPFRDRPTVEKVLDFLRYCVEEKKELSS